MSERRQLQPGEPCVILEGIFAYPAEVISFVQDDRGTAYVVVEAGHQKTRIQERVFGLDREEQQHLVNELRSISLAAGGLADELERKLNTEISTK